MLCANFLYDELFFRKLTKFDFSCMLCRRYTKPVMTKITFARQLSV